LAAAIAQVKQPGGKELWDKVKLVIEYAKKLLPIPPNWKKIIDGILVVINALI
jgi:hypothetical protein